MDEDGETDLSLLKVQFPSVSLEHRASLFDIVTVEGEGCSAAGWEEMSGGDTERITDGICGDATDDRALLGFLADLGCFRIIHKSSSYELLPNLTRLLVKGTQIVYVVMCFLNPSSRGCHHLVPSAD